jgi:serine/threonine protein kinase
MRRDMLTVIGTPFYEAPEVFLGGGYDERIDIWALGITIFKLITGRTPFESEYHHTTINKIKAGIVSFHDSIWDSYSHHSKLFVMELLKGKDERMTLDEALNHFWLRETAKIERSRSTMLKRHEDFHD